jgi:hypothetical protein
MLCQNIYSPPCPGERVLDLARYTWAQIKRLDGLSTNSRQRGFNRSPSAGQCLLNGCNGCQLGVRSNQIESNRRAADFIGDFNLDSIAGYPVVAQSRLPILSGRVQYHP